jgi:energy-coupling factor transporter ATP-binding protein EcfA2
MKVSTSSREDRYKVIALLSLLTALLLFFHRLPLSLFCVFPAAGAGLLIARGKLQRRSARTPIRQVAYASLIEPVYHYYDARVGRDEDGHALTERRREVVGHRRRDVPVRKSIDPCYVDFDEYLSGKSNRLVMICGRSGTGKSELMKVLLLSVKAPKIVFSFKPNDTHLRLPYPVIDVSSVVPNPFQDADDFSIAYALAFPANLRGIMLSQVRATVKNLAHESRDWDQFKANLKKMEAKATDIQSEALALVRQQIEGLAVAGGPGSSFSVDLTTDAVLDFSRLDESAKTFYAEVALRQIWNSLTGGKSASFGADPRKAVIVIDEVHRLTQMHETDARSILDTIMREVRQFGSLYTATQNHTDVPDSLRQFGTEVAFQTTSERDLEAMGRIDPAYPWIVKELRPHEFIDLTFRVGNEGLVPIFRADILESPRGEAERQMVVTTSHSERDLAPDYVAIIAERIDKGEVVWVSRLAAIVEERFGVEKDAAKLKLRSVLVKLLAAGEIQVQKYDGAESGETVSLYFAKSGEEKVSPLHKFMVKRLLEKLAENGEAVLRVAESGQGAPDVETEAAYYEIETGLKTRTADLEQRISALSATKPFVILVPNSDAAKSEKYGKLKGPRVVVATLAEFARVGAASRDSA